MVFTFFHACRLASTLWISDEFLSVQLARNGAPVSSIIVSSTENQTRNGSKGFVWFFGLFPGVLIFLLKGMSHD